MKSYPQFEGEYKAPAHKSSTVRGSYMGGNDSAGVEAGLNHRSEFDSEASSDFSLTQAPNPISGNPRQAIGKKTGYKVSSKGNSFDLGC